MTNKYREVSHFVAFVHLVSFRCDSIQLYKPFCSLRHDYVMLLAKHIHFSLHHLLKISYAVLLDARIENDLKLTATASQRSKNNGRIGLKGKC